MTNIGYIRYKTYYWFLKKSGIWRYWHEKFLNELMYDLDVYDIDKKEVTDKYNKKLEDFRNNKQF